MSEMDEEVTFVKSRASHFVAGINANLPSAEKHTVLQKDAQLVAEAVIGRYFETVEQQADGLRQGYEQWGEYIIRFLQLNASQQPRLEEETIVYAGLPVRLVKKEGRFLKVIDSQTTVIVAVNAMAKILVHDESGLIMLHDQSSNDTKDPTELFMDKVYDGNEPATDWRGRAKCLDEDPELFFSESKKLIKEAKKVCEACPVNTQCLTRGLGVTHGVWGGKSRIERTNILKRSSKANRRRA